MENLTNYELASNSTWSIAESLVSCEFCHYVSRELETNLLCVHCNKVARAPFIFPEWGAVTILELVCHFYSLGTVRREDRASALARQLFQQLQQTYTPDLAMEIAREVQGVRGRLPTGSHAEFREMLDIIRKRLALGSLDEARRVFAPLFGYSDTNEEHQVTVLMTAVLLETLLKQLLVKMNARSGMALSQSRKRIRQWNGLEKFKSEFEKLAGVCLEQVFEEVQPGFFVGWEELRQRRNKFMHGQPSAISQSDAEAAFELAKEAFEVFAQLHNRFCVA